MIAIIPGLAMSILIGTAAYLFGLKYPLIGGPIFGILIGIIISNTKPISKRLQPGIAFSGRKVLQWSIILLGFGLSIEHVLTTGIESFAVMVFTMAAAFLMAIFAGGALQVKKPLITLIGVGTAICGGSAIAAVAPIIDAADDEIAYAISTIFLFNIAAVFIFPLVGHLLDMNADAFGMFAGTAINDTSSVVAAGYSYSIAAGDYATIVKLTRTVMIVPIAFAIALIMKPKENSAKHHFSIAKTFPWFVIGFIAASAITSLKILPSNVTMALSQLGKFAIIIALSAIGLSTDLRKLMATGYKPLLLGLLVWAAVSLSSIIVQFFMGQL